MPNESEIAIRELEQTITILNKIKKRFNDPSMIKDLGEYDLVYLQNVYNRVRRLSSQIFSSSDSFDAWVGPIRKFEEGENNFQIKKVDSELTERLFEFVYGFIYARKNDESLERLTKENASLKGQLEELRQREATYRAIIEKARTPTSPESRDILLNSLKRQAMLMTKNLSTLQEVKAKAGLNPPIDVLSGIEQMEQELEQISFRIAELAGEDKT